MKNTSFFKLKAIQPFSIIKLWLRPDHDTISYEKGNGKMAYSLNDVAMITGLTTRTLRNYLKLNLLSGEKIDGNWSFTPEELDAFMSAPAVKQAIKAKRNAIVYDFLSDPVKKGNRVCTIMDLPVSAEEATEAADFFCDLVNKNGSDITFTFNMEKGFARFILSGPEDQVADFMKAYYER